MSTEFEARAAGTRVGDKIFEGEQRSFGKLDLSNPAVVESIAVRMEAQLQAEIAKLTSHSDAWVAWFAETARGTWPPRLRQSVHLAAQVTV